ncbi:LysM peptidoglycan-binding domain-containing protein [Pseudactinotalea sp. Z1748]|uniref:LysM peptidoglycan-binding domain-containing protein n=1 Tax=Pseudactinotalea sp. Z1748 TaxID=3413027 RepID=UPI003C7AF9FD
MSGIRQLLRAIVAAVVLALLLVGIPAALWTFGVRPPQSVPSWEQLRLVLTTPDTGGVFLALLTVVGWLAWVAFAVAVVGEVRALRMGRPARPIRGLGLAQQLAAILLGAIIITAAGPAVSAAADSGQDGQEPADSSGVATTQRVDEGDERSGAQEHEHDVHQAPTYTVQPGDSLWKVAEQFLGDGQRWAEIADLNYDRVQPDGSQLDRQDRWLQPGWVLELPAEVAGQEEQTEVEVTDASAQLNSGSGISFTHTVQPGETLRAITQMHLGDADQVMEVFEANRGVVQADGDALTDPDHLRPGWQLQYSTAHTPDVTVHAQPATAEEDLILAGLDLRAPVPDDTTPGVVDHGAPILDAADDMPADAPGQDVDVSASSSWTTWGGGGLLAAGLVSVVSARRALAQRERPSGQRLQMPAGPSAVLEAELRYVADSEGVAMVDAALREVGEYFTAHGRGLPRLAAARTHQGTVRLYLDRPDELPQPWVGTHANTVWSRPPVRDLPEPSEPDQVVAGAPFPALVTVGRDEAGPNVHIDIEHVGLLSIDGPMTLATAALRAMVVELATNPWTEGARITLVGCLPELAEVVPTGRLRHVKSLSEVQRSLYQSAMSTREILAAAGVVDIPQARGMGVAQDAHSPEIVVIGTPLSVEESTWLAELTSNRASGVVGLGLGLEAARWTVQVADANRAHLEPAGLAVQPQLLDESNYAACLDVLTRASRTVPGPQWAANLTEDEPLLGQTVEASVVEQAPSGGQVIELRPPTIRVLGPVVMEAEHTGPLRPSHEAQALEILTYLALHRQVDGHGLSEAIWPGLQPNTSTRNSAVSRARAWLGEDPTGQPYLRRVADDGLYELAEVGTDWEHFTSLVRRGLTKVAVADLMSALSLVRGVPFDRSRPGRYRLRAGRYAWAEFLAEEMTASIADVAYAASTRSLSAQRPAQGLQAARTGLQVAPWEERLWRCVIRCQWAMSDTDGIGRTVANLEAQLVKIGAEPEAETHNLLDQIEDRLNHPTGSKARQAAW